MTTIRFHSPKIIMCITRRGSYTQTVQTLVRNIFEDELSEQSDSSVYFMVVITQNTRQTSTEITKETIEKPSQ